MIDRTKDFCFQLIGNAVIFFKWHLFFPSLSGKSTNRKTHPHIELYRSPARARWLKANYHRVFYGPEPEEPK